MIDWYQLSIIDDPRLSIDFAHVQPNYFSTNTVNLVSDQSVKSPHLDIHEGLGHRLIFRLLMHGQPCLFEDGLELAGRSEALVLLYNFALPIVEDIVEDKDEGRRLISSSRFNSWSDKLRLCSSQKSGQRRIV